MRAAGAISVGKRMPVWDWRRGPATRVALQGGASPEDRFGVRPKEKVARSGHASCANPVNQQDLRGTDVPVR
jgi:hypothetical protein